MEPAVVLVARPVFEGMVANAYRIHMMQATNYKRCSVGVILCNIQREAWVMFAKQVGEGRGESGGVLCAPPADFKTAVCCSLYELCELPYPHAQVIPPDFTGLRFKVRCWTGGGTIVVKADHLDGGLLLGAATVKSTIMTTDGDPEWQLVECRAERHVDLHPHTIILKFSDPDCCEMEWFEFFVDK